MKIERIETLDRLTVNDELLLRYNKAGEGPTIHGCYKSHDYKSNECILRISHALSLNYGFTFSANDIKPPDALMKHLDDMRKVIRLEDELTITLPKIDDLTRSHLFHLVRVFR